MTLLKHIHRDVLQRIIKHGDMVVWSNGKQGQNMRIGRVVGTTPKQVQMYMVDTKRPTKAYPSRLIVITQQIAANIAGNVGTPNLTEETND